MMRKVFGLLVCALFFSACGDEAECRGSDYRSCGVRSCDGYQYCNAETGTWGDCSSLNTPCGDCCVCIEIEGEIQQYNLSPDPSVVDYCNGRDDDCDGTIDEGNSWQPCECTPPGERRQCGLGEGECAVGWQACVRDGESVVTSHWSGCIDAVEPVEEICDGLDNDCDGLTDNNLVEICDGLDNDCDGLADEDFTCRAGSTVNCTTSCGSTGSGPCSSFCDGALYCLPPVETCNNRDDDCDGSTDEDFACRQGSTGSCVTACGSTGSQTCDSACNWGACTPPTEVCNGRDDDCDGATDEDFGCRQGSAENCATLCGSTGTRTCSTACLWGVCTPPAEICNGRDDDCDGSVDEGFDCRQGSTGSCTTSCGSSTGTRTCSTACLWGACTPPAEICNGRDDDCDGATDEDSTCRSGSTGSCITSCGSTGSRICSSSCSWGTCTPPAEVCNGRDDNCNGQIDEGCCIDADRDGYFATSSCPSGNDCNDSNAAIHPDATEICDDLDNDCNGSTDVIASRTVANVTTTYEVGCTMGDGCCDSSSIGIVQTAVFDPSWFSGMTRTRITASVDYAYYARDCPPTPNAEVALVTVVGGTSYRQSRTFGCEVQQAVCGTTTPWGSFPYTWTFSAGTLPSQTYLEVVRDGYYGVKYRNWRVTVEVDCY